MTANDAIVFALGILVVLAVAMLLRTATGGDRQWRRRRVQCPDLGSTAELAVEQDVRTGRWVDVKECSLLPEGEAVVCDKVCLKLLEHRAGRVGARDSLRDPAGTRAVVARPRQGPGKGPASGRDGRPHRR